jgi:hypothetical protein
MDSWSIRRAKESFRLLKEAARRDRHIYPADEERRIVA